MKTAPEILKDYYDFMPDDPIVKIRVSIILEAMEEYHSQFALTKEMSPRVAKLIIQIRDLFIEAKDTPLDTMEEIWHFLYQIASPNYDKECSDVWSELELLAIFSVEQGKERPTITDEEIEKCARDFIMKHSNYSRAGLIIGAKAMRDGLISIANEKTK